ncbi:MAG: hypothetical protein PHN47_06900, partial [Clostridia bacterium]|nr:hypothetical protein [Clostridia bacterium]
MDKNSTQNPYKQSLYRKRVLIYPYWNVNKIVEVDKQIVKTVLIYPYWNVNLTDEEKRLKYEEVLIYPYWNVNA